MNGAGGQGGDPAVAMMNGQLQAVHSELSSIREAVSRLAESYAKLALLEERQVVTRESVERAFTELTKHDERIKALEIAQPVQARTTTWVEKAAGLVLAAVIGGAVVNYLPQRAARDASPPSIQSRP